MPIIRAQNTRKLPPPLKFTLPRANFISASIKARELIFNPPPKRRHLIGPLPASSARFLDTHNWATKWRRHEINVRDYGRQFLRLGRHVTVTMVTDQGESVQGITGRF
ncbi:hypothetical protein NPIL_485161 [Nephila pilipes]|uniref:Uncharacterized protein n=1 Tax=Nephila pilipes TaxID=299642 RepID=A0A8X6PI09_NEPPI|nr:hypothetical protein NPIL_485161 [Nephila pilipes]